MAKVEPFYNPSRDEYDHYDDNSRRVYHDESECHFGRKVIEGGCEAKGAEGGHCKRCIQIAQRREGVTTGA